VPPYSAPYLLLEEEKAETEQPQVLQVHRAAVAVAMAEPMLAALATRHQLAPLKETLVALARAMARVRNLAAAVVVGLEQLDQTLPEPRLAELVARERLVRLLERALLALAAGVVAPML